MTTFVILLGVLILGVVGLGVGLWRLSRGSTAPHDKQIARTAVHNYRPMTRLFDGRDLTFLKTQPGYRRGMARQLRLQRRKSLELYLKQVHTEFRLFWSYCRELGPHTENPEIAVAAANQLFMFYALFAVLKLQSWLGWVIYVPMDARKLVAVVRSLQQSVRQTTQQTSERWGSLATNQP